MTAVALLVVALPPPSPALVLHEAAARLRAAAAAARASETAKGRTQADWYADMADGYLGGPVGVFCGLLSPDAADELADWLDATAVEAVRLTATGLGAQTDAIGPYPTTIARRILEAT